MKQVILSILTSGSYHGEKYNTADLKRWLPFIDLIVGDVYTPENGKCNGVWSIGSSGSFGTKNAFWSPDNNENRITLLHDVHAVRKLRNKPISESAGMKKIMDRFENGDKYGIEV